MIYGDVLIICLHPSTLRIPAISMPQICQHTGACSAKEFFPSFLKLSYIIDTSLTTKEESLTFLHKLTGRISECLCVCVPTKGVGFSWLCVCRGCCHPEAWLRSVRKDLNLPNYGRVALHSGSASWTDPDVMIEQLASAVIQASLFSPRKPKSLKTTVKSPSPACVNMCRSLEI